MTDAELIAAIRKIVNERNRPTRRIVGPLASERVDLDRYDRIVGLVKRHTWEPPAEEAPK